MNYAINPVAVRLGDRIHVVCVNSAQQLVHLEAGSHTQWSYKSWVIKSDGPVSGLSGVGCKEFVFDIYFIQGNKLMHGSSLKSNKWAYNFEVVASDNFKPVTACTRFEDTINVFAVDGSGTIAHYFTNDKIGWTYQSKKKAFTDLPPFHSDLTILQSHEHIDLFYFAQSKIQRLYCGPNGVWVKPAQIE